MKNLPEIELNNDEKLFLFEIDSRIKALLLELPESYHNSLQIVRGSRFRPLLTYYGYTLYSDELNETIYQSATAIELIHKASIIIDDIIDQDKKRHGMPTVHQQYSLNEALIISVFLLGKCIEMLSDIDDSTVRLFSQMIIKMCQGTLSELNINDETAIADIRKILDNQTSQVIQNSLLIGMKSYNESINNQYLEIAGYKLGYLFQLLNDCEVYFNPEFSIKYKGNMNFDINKQRKNLCYSYLEQSLNNKEKSELDRGRYSILGNLLNKYNILDSIKKEIYCIELDIQNNLNILGETMNVQRLSFFIDYAINLAKTRANIK